MSKSTKLEFIPWWLKLGAKLLLSRIPVSYTIWSKIGLFRHGYMGDFSYVINNYETHRRLALPHLPPNPVVLEMGPGDSVGTALVARAYGAAGCYLMDVGRFADDDLTKYARLADELAKRGLPLGAWAPSGSLDELTASLGARYMTRGLSDYAAIPAGSVHHIFSTSVLEHVFKDEFEATVKAWKRVLAPGGVVTHWVDLKDHLGYSLNNLRFSERVWESRLFRNSGFYTNRLRQSEILDIVARNGFTITARRDVHWEHKVLPREKMHPAFRGFSDEEMAVRGFEFVAVSG